MSNRSRDDYPEGETSTAQWWEAKAQRMDEEIAADLAYARSLPGKIDHARRLSNLISHYRVEGGVTEERIAELKGQLEALNAEIAQEKAAKQMTADEKFWADWTPAAWEERRERWNALVRSGKYVNRQGKIDGLGMAKLEREAGFTLQDMKKAAARYK